MERKNRNSKLIFRKHVNRGGTEGGGHKTTHRKPTYNSGPNQ